MIAIRADDRDAWLRLDDGALLRQCRQERYRASGPGGQRRNKAETAVRLRHGPSGLTAHAEDSRSPETNRKRALRRLRERMALELRRPLDLESPSLPPELEAQRRAGALSINPRNPAYPIVVAMALDAVGAAAGRYGPAARALGLTTSQLVRFLRSDPQIWRSVRESGTRRAVSEGG